MLKERKFLLGMIMGVVIGGTIATVQPMEAKKVTKAKSEMSLLIKEVKAIKKHTASLDKNSKSTSKQLKEISKDIKTLSARQGLATPSGI